jgi:hypothetical protein
MITGRLKTAGYHVPRDQVAASFLWVHGSSGTFGDHSIHRKVESDGTIGNSARFRRNWRTP